MRIFAVIPVYNRKDITRLCLASFQKQTEKNFTIVVIDDGSTDRTSEMVETEFPDVVLLHGDGNLWWVGSVNKGIRYVLERCHQDDYILVINDDLTVPPDYIASLRDAALSNDGAIVGSVETLQTSPNIIKSGGIQVNWKTVKRKVLNKDKSLDQFPKGHIVRVDRLTGRGTLFPSRVFREAGLYDEVHFRQCGDTELPVRANFKHGFPLLVSYDAVVVSQPMKSTNINGRKYYTLSDFREYFFGIRSHFNLIDKFWIAHNIAPNKLWFVRYYLLNALRIVGRYVTRLRIRPKSD